MTYPSFYRSRNLTIYLGFLDETTMVKIAMKKPDLSELTIDYTKNQEVINLWMEHSDFCNKITRATFYRAMESETSELLNLIKRNKPKP